MLTGEDPAEIAQDRERGRRLLHREGRRRSRQSRLAASTRSTKSKHEDRDAHDAKLEEVRRRPVAARTGGETHGHEAEAALIEYLQTQQDKLARNAPSPRLAIERERTKTAAQAVRGDSRRRRCRTSASGSTADPAIVEQASGHRQRSKAPSPTIAGRRQNPDDASVSRAGTATRRRHGRTRSRSRTSSRAADETTIRQCVDQGRTADDREGSGRSRPAGGDRTSDGRPAQQPEFKDIDDVETRREADAGEQRKAIDEFNRCDAKVDEIDRRP